MLSEEGVTATVPESAPSGVVKFGKAKFAKVREDLGEEAFIDPRREFRVRCLLRVGRAVVRRNFLSSEVHGEELFLRNREFETNCLTAYRRNPALDLPDMEEEVVVGL